MPRGDGTGPMGFGPMTGRAAGFCAGFPVPGHMNSYPGWGRGRGRGRRLGRRDFARPYWGWYGPGPWGAPVYPHPVFPGYLQPNPSSDEEKEMLKEQAEMLKDQLDDILARLEELEGKQEKDEQ